MSSYRELLNEAQNKMLEADLGEQAALFYLLELTDMKSHNLYMEMDEEVDSEIEAKYKEGIERLLTGEPLGHILGFEWFYGYRFKVSENVLIPRPETEELVGYVLAAYDEMFEGKDVIACDIGTGSGAIAISLKLEEPRLHIVASDISEEALEVARENAKELNANVSFLCGSMLEPLIERNIKVDILVSNPPYIKSDAQMEKSVVDYEPHVALFGGEDGLKFYRMIFENAHKVLKDKAFMAFEMGYDQKDDLIALAKQYYPKARIEAIQDMNRKDRMLFVYID